MTLVLHHQAVAICCELTDAFNRAGYVLGLYGSCLTATAGRDVDVVAVPWRHPDRNILEVALTSAGWREDVARRYSGITADSTIYQRADIILDVRFVRHPPAPATAEAWPCSFSHHEHATQQDAVQCARDRRPSASTVATLRGTW